MNCPICSLYFPVTAPPHVCGSQDVEKAVHEWLDGMEKPMKTNHGLDVEDVWTGDEWQIWTPDTTGGILGSGKTLNEALADAVANMEALCAEIREELSHPQVKARIEAGVRKEMEP